MLFARATEVVADTNAFTFFFESNSRLMRDDVLTRLINEVLLWRHLSWSLCLRFGSGVYADAANRIAA